MPIAIFVVSCYTYTSVIWGVYMTISYKKLWKLLIDKDMKKSDLIKVSGISGYTLNKLVNGKTVTSETLMKICAALDCTFDDIMEIIEVNN